MLLIIVSMLESLITSKTRLRLLVKFFINAANQGHLRGLAEEFSESTNAIRKELNNLSEAGYLEKEAIRNTISYRANTNHPLFSLLQSVVRRTIGLDTIVATILERMGNVKKVFLIGDYAEGRDTGTIEVVLVGEVLNEEYVDQLAYKIEGEIKRKVKFLLSDHFEGNGLLLFGRED